MGCLVVGLTVVNRNPCTPRVNLNTSSRDSGAHGILVIENFASVLAEVIDRTDVKHVVVTGLLGSAKLVERARPQLPCASRRQTGA